MKHICRSKTCKHLVSSDAELLSFTRSNFAEVSHGTYQLNDYYTI